MPRRLPLLPICITITLLAAQVLGAPALSDPTGAALPEGLHLHFPILNRLFAPLFDLWDGVSMLGMSRLLGFVGWLLAYYIVWRVAAGIHRHRNDPDAGPPIVLLRELSGAVLYLVLLAAFLAGGILWHRPMAALDGAPPNVMVVDFHSHTNASHDVKGTLMNGFDAEANRRWHARAGFDAFFVTDHNVIGGPAVRRSGGPQICPGIEISAWRAHIVLLGATYTVAQAPRGSALAGVLQLLRDAGPKYHAISIASLPEYERNHWENLSAFIQAGVGGFEIVNASPKANEITTARRDSVIALVRANRRLLVGASDLHGWGATSMVWNLVPVLGWHTASDPCASLLDVLRSGDGSAVQIVERHRLRADAWWPGPLTPIGVTWETWRALEWPRLLSWLLWSWGGWWVVAAWKERKAAA